METLSVSTLPHLKDKFSLETKNALSRGSLLLCEFEENRFRNIIKNVSDIHKYNGELGEGKVDIGSLVRVHNLVDASDIIHYLILSEIAWKYVYDNKKGSFNNPLIGEILVIRYSTPPGSNMLGLASGEKFSLVDRQYIIDEILPYDSSWGDDLGVVGTSSQKLEIPLG